MTPTEVASGDWSLPPHLEQAREALEAAQEAFEELQSLVKGLPPDVEDLYEFEQASTTVDELLDRIDAVDPDLGDDDTPHEADALELLRDISEIEAESFAGCIRDMDGPTADDEEMDELNEMEVAQLRQAFNKAEKAAWHAYHVMIGAV